MVLDNPDPELLADLVIASYLLEKFADMVVHHGKATPCYGSTRENAWTKGGENTCAWYLES